MDTPVPGSENILENKNLLNDLSEHLKVFEYEIKRYFLLSAGKNVEEKTLILHMLAKCKYGLLRLKSISKDNAEAQKVQNLIKSVDKIMSRDSFKGIYTFMSHTDIQSLMMKSAFMVSIYRKYKTFMRVLEQCISSGFSVSDDNYFCYKSDVLVGTLRNRKQLDTVLKNKFYHIPSVMIPDDKTNISYIAIYQSKNLFGKESGIRYFGKVVSSEKVERKDILEIPSESEELYIRYNVHKWNTLDNPVSSGYSGTVVGFTNLHMLLHADVTDELYFTNESEYKLYRSIKSALQKGYNRVFANYKGCVIAINNGNISVYKNRRLMYNVPVSDYIKNPVSRFNSIIKICASINDKGKR